MYRVVPLLVALAAAALFPVRVTAQISDHNLTGQIAEAIRTYPRYGVFDSVDVDVQDRAVTLSGAVTEPRKKGDIEERVRKIDGIRALTNEIAVPTLSPSDNELRYRVAQSIYNHPMFWVHGQRPLPPIHIVVESGRVTLTGVADTEEQRALAMSLAQVPGSSGVSNRITVRRH